MERVENTVATLPDLTQMESQTYVNEVDVRKITVGQKVSISLDADPSKKLAGTVTHIANVGEQKPNQDSKVFEVKIEVAKADTTLRPGMTTANEIETAAIPNVLSIPLEAVVTEGGYQYAYKKEGNRVVKQMIETGAMNDNEIIVKRGLSKDRLVLLTPPADKAGIKTEAIDGLKPVTVPAPGADSAKSIQIPAAKPTVTPASGAKVMTPAVTPPAPAQKKG